MTFSCFVLTRMRNSFPQGTFPPHCVCHFPALPFVIFLPLCSSFSCHFVCHFPAILFVIFPPLRSSVVTLPLFPPLYLSSRSSPSCLYVDNFFTWLPLRLSFSCHYVLHFSPKGLYFFGLQLSQIVSSWHWSHIKKL